MGYPPISSSSRSFVRNALASASPHVRHFPPPRGAYGVVRIARGRYAGNPGFYDDDDENGTSIVYPWGSAPAGYVVVRNPSLAKATRAEAKLWESVNENPFAARTVLTRFRDKLTL